MQVDIFVISKVVDGQLLTLLLLASWPASSADMTRFTLMFPQLMTGNEP